MVACKATHRGSTVPPRPGTPQPRPHPPRGSHPRAPQWPPLPGSPAWLAVPSSAACLKLPGPPQPSVPGSPVPPPGPGRSSFPGSPVLPSRVPPCPPFTQATPCSPVPGSPVAPPSRSPPWPAAVPRWLPSRAHPGAPGPGSPMGPPPGLLRGPGPGLPRGSPARASPCTPSLASPWPSVPPGSGITRVLPRSVFPRPPRPAGHYMSPRLGIPRGTTLRAPPCFPAPYSPCLPVPSSPCAAALHERALHERAGSRHNLKPDRGEHQAFFETALQRPHLQVVRANTSTSPVIQC